MILVATPAAGSKFDGWSGDCAATVACSLSMSAARSVTAKFSRVRGVIRNRATLATSAYKATSAGVVTLSIGNPNQAAAQGEVTLTTQPPAASKRKRKTVTVGHASFTIPATSRARVKLPLNKKGRALLRKNGTLRVKARIVLRANGTSKAVTLTITIKKP